ncbi:hypothetical protein KAW43_01265 [Candidatus Parcubacteria bacterium]|nr:hypothetical protein [Candidatus Parcubacteria bacterium]
MKKIFESFGVHKKAKTEKSISGFRKITEADLDLMPFNIFVKKMIDEGYYAQGLVVFLEKMIEQIETFNQYFFTKVSDKDVLHIDTSILEGYIDWLQKIIMHLNKLESAFQGNNIVRQIADIQERISYVYADITMQTGSIDRFLRTGLLEQAIPSYFSVIRQIRAFHNGSTLNELREILEQVKNIID